MLNESNYEQKSDAVLIDADFSNDPSLSNDILNKFEENISEESIVQCESPVLNELDFDYNSNDFILNVVYPYHEITSNVYSSQCEKYILNEVTSFITWGYEDP
ncbi:unnamed protein product [Schistosoma mattheei]|uniref:Uncharacterized protein n=1 Tax=Schistosoma mattheei TaxID=31246 RepID=A0A183NPV3_9TREM|nr:unnamed protein product [Schistosoma mattheei]